MRRKNQCIIYSDKNGVYPECGCEHSAMKTCLHSEFDDGDWYCRYCYSWECKNKVAANDAAFRLVKTLRKKYGVSE